MEGAVVGRWRLGDCLGAATWDGVDSVSGEPVVVRAASPGSPDAAAVRAEASALAAIAHPHLARPAGVVETGDVVAVATRPVAGPSLASLLAGGRTLPWPQAAAVLAPVASALAAVHDAGWVHGDVSAANVVVGAEGGVLVDLGCARPAGLAAATGTPGSVAPEVAAGAPVTPAADVRALAAVAAEAVGRPLPADAALVLGRALAPDPAERPTAAHLAAALALAAGDLPAVAAGGRAATSDPWSPTTRDHGPRPPAPPARQPTHPRRAGPAAAVAVLALVAAAGGAALAMRAGAGEPGPAPAGAGGQPPSCPPLPPGTALAGDPDGDGCDVPARWADGVLTVALAPGEAPARFAVGAPGDVVALGDWDCDGDDTPGAYRPGTGTLTLWDDWPGRGAVAPSTVTKAVGMPVARCR